MTAPVAIAAVRRQVRELVDGTLEIKLHVEPRFKQDFHRLFPEIDVPVALAPLVLKPEPMAEPPTDDAREPNALAQKLHSSGYFRASKLWLAMHDSGIYTAQMHFKWLATVSECAFGAERTVQMGPCRGDVITHHCPAANTIPGGTRQPEAPRKPLHFYGLRICDGHHTWAHTSTGATREDKADMLGMAVALTAGQMKSHMKEVCGIESLRELTPEMLSEFEGRIGL